MALSHSKIEMSELNSFLATSVVGETSVLFSLYWAINSSVLTGCKLSPCEKYLANFIIFSLDLSNPSLEELI